MVINEQLFLRDRKDIVSIELEDKLVYNEKDSKVIKLTLVNGCVHRISTDLKDFKDILVVMNAETDNINFTQSFAESIKIINNNKRM